MKLTGLHQSAFLTLILVGTTLPAFGAGISFACAANVDATAAGTCNTLNTTIAGDYSSAFTDANALIFIQYGATGLGASVQYRNTVTYADYHAALVASSSGANDATAIASLGASTTVNPVVSGDGISITSALGQRLSLTGYSGISSVDESSCTVGTANCFNGIVTIADNQPYYYRSGAQTASQFDYFAVVQHEVNEVLGTGSCLTTVAGAPGVGCTGTAPTDLFRYSAPGVRSYLGAGGNQANGTLAYFSINSGTTSLAEYNNQPNDADYGDWGSAAVRVQNAFTGNGVFVGDNGAPEIGVLDAIGYTRNSQLATPEPASIALFGSGLALLAGFSRRRRKA